MENGKESAFPFVGEFQSDYSDKYYAPGLTKREYFAAMAMQGLLSNHGVGALISKVSIASVEYADGLLKQLENENQ